MTRHTVPETSARMFGLAFVREWRGGPSDGSPFALSDPTIAFGGVRRSGVLAVRLDRDPGTTPRPIAGIFDRLDGR